MKVRLTGAMALILALLLTLAGCQKAREERVAEGIESETIYASFFPLYALALGVLDGAPNITLRCLVQPQDGCLREYALSEWDMIRILNADAMILGGRGLESFEGALSALGEQGPALMSVMSGLTLIGQEEQAVEGDEMESHLEGANPWLFLSVDGAKGITEEIAAGMATLDPGFDALYFHNLERRLEALDELQRRMMECLLTSAPKPVGLLHEGFVYLAEDLGLDVAVRVDREPGTELYGADLETALTRLEQSGARVVLLEKQAPARLKRAMEENGYSVALIDTFSTFSLDAEPDYYDQVMMGNAEAILKAFQGA